MDNLTLEEEMALIAKESTGLAGIAVEELTNELAEVVQKLLDLRHINGVLEHRCKLISGVEELKPQEITQQFYYLSSTEKNRVVANSIYGHGLRMREEMSTLRGKIGNVISILQSKRGVWK